MDGKRKRLMLIILTMESEMLIGSTVLFLKYYLYKRARIGFDLIVIDNCSKDRTLITAQKAGAEVLCLNERYEWREVVRTALDIGKESLARTIVILDLTGGNDAEDAISLISRSLKEDERFASGYIAPTKGPVGKTMKANSEKFATCARDSVTVQTGSIQRLILRFTIDADGHVHKPRISNMSAGDPDLHGCVLRTLSRIKFPPPQDGESKEITYPLVLRPE